MQAALKIFQAETLQRADWISPIAFDFDPQVQKNFPVALNQKFNDRKKDNFTAVQIRTDKEQTFLTLRSNGKLFDYRKYFSENPREDLLRLVDAWKFKFVLGLNNFYAQVR